MIRHLLTGAVAAATLAVASPVAQAGTGGTVPGSTPTPTAATTYKSTIEAAYKYEWEDVVHATLRVTRTNSFGMVLPVAGETIKMQVARQTGTGGIVDGHCEGVSDANGRLSCALKATTPSTGTTTGWWLATVWGSGTYGSSNPNYLGRMVDIICHC